MQMSVSWGFLAGMGASLLAATTLVACSTEVPDVYLVDTSGVFFAWSEYGVEITEFEEWGRDARGKANGAVELSGIATVSIEGKGSREIAAVATIEPPERGGQRSLTTLDKTTDNTRGFFWDPDENAVFFGTDDAGVAVWANPDGSYDLGLTSMAAFRSPVELVHAEGYEVFHRLQEYAAFTEGSEHALMLAASMGMGAQIVPESRSMPTCSIPNCPTGCGGGADGPILCDLFPEICVCITCSVAGNDETDLCQPCTP